MTRHGSIDFLSAAKSNPEGLLLLAAGFALLMRSGSSSGARMSGRGSADQHFQHHPGQAGGGWRVPEGVSQATQTARDYAAGVGERVSSVGERISGMGEQVRETAGAYVASAGNFASEAGRNVSDHSMRFARQAQSTVEGTVNRVLQEQPLAVVLAGLAAGAAVAAMFPATEIEQRTLGPAGDRVADFAERTGEQFKEAVGKASERLMSAAEDRGLNADGLREVAREVAGAFGSTFSSGQGSGSGQSGGKQSGSAGSSGPSGMPGGSGMSGSAGSSGSSGSSFGAGQSSGTGQGLGGSSAASGRSQQSGESFSDTQGKPGLNPDAARSPQPAKSNPNLKS